MEDIPFSFVLCMGTWCFAVLAKIEGRDDFCVIALAVTCLIMMLTT